MGISTDSMKNNLFKWAVIASGTAVIATAIGIFIQRKKKPIPQIETDEDIKGWKDSSANTNSLIQDIFKAETLYKKLITKVHPDRFTDPSVKLQAEELSKEITKNKHSYSKLLELELKVDMLLK